MTTTDSNLEKKSFNLKDLIDIPSEMLESLNLNTEEDKEKERLQNIEALKKKLREKRNSLRNNRLGKRYKEDNQIKTLKENPLFQNLNGNFDSPEIKMAIENMASKMSNDPKQKKNIKKQMENLLEKMK